MPEGSWSDHSVELHRRYALTSSKKALAPSLGKDWFELFCLSQFRSKGGQTLNDGANKAKTKKNAFIFNLQCIKTINYECYY